MDSQSQKQAAALAALSAADRARLEHLAALDETTPEQLWPDVWLYGFNDVEEGILAAIEADEYFKNHRGIDHAEVMLRVNALVAAHGKRQCEAE